MPVLRFWIAVPVGMTMTKSSSVRIFSFTADPVNIAITCGINLAVMGALVYLLKRMFDNEKVMFAV